MIESELATTVVIPCYKHADTLGRAVQSALHQNCVHKVIIVVDGSCRSDHVRACQLAHYRGVSYESTGRTYGQPHGAGYARNMGLTSVSTPLVAFLDADDEYIDNRLDEVVLGLHPQSRTNLIAMPMEYVGLPPEIETSGYYKSIAGDLVYGSIGNTVMRTELAKIVRFPEDEFLRDHGGEDGVFRAVWRNCFTEAVVVGKPCVRVHVGANNHIVRATRKGNYIGKIAMPEDVTYWSSFDQEVEFRTCRVMRLQEMMAAQSDEIDVFKI
jgi:glycosyltransferase involved in cell wall biosynthesis